MAFWLIWINHICPVSNIMRTGVSEKHLKCNNQFNTKQKEVNACWVFLILMVIILAIALIGSFETICLNIPPRLKGRLSSQITSRPCEPLLDIWLLLYLIYENLLDTQNKSSTLWNGIWITLRTVFGKREGSQYTQHCWFNDVDLENLKL